VRRRRRLVAVVLVLMIVAAAVGLTIAVSRTIVAPVVEVARDPGEGDGVIPSERPATLADTGLPAIANLDPGLRDALAGAEAAASAEGIVFEITSGWRSRPYQEWLFRDAVTTYGSSEVAAQFVAAPDRSSHVTGEAVDIASLDAQLWLGEHGATWGLCQIYANERWHFERATTPDGVCPPQLMDASG